MKFWELPSSYDSWRLASPFDNEITYCSCCGEKLNSDDCDQCIESELLEDK